MLAYHFLVALGASTCLVGGEELTVRETAAARDVYVAKCAKCHEFYDPKNYSERDWRKWLGKMEKKAKLKDEQAGQLRRYLDEYRAGHLAGKPEGDAKAARAAKPAERK
jgi:hypothetical protein